MTFFTKEEQAFECMKKRNRAAVKFNNKTFYAMVDGPENNFCVMTIKDAIETGLTYSWAV